MAGALISGVSIFLVIAHFVDMGLTGPPGAGPGEGGAANAGAARGGAVDFVGTLMTYLALAWAAVLLPLSVIVPARIAKQNRRKIVAGTWTPQLQGVSPPRQFDPEAFKTDENKLAMVYASQFIIGAALIEGGAFLAGVAYMMGKQPLALGVAVFLVGVLLARFPTLQRVQSWIDRQQEQLILERQAAI